MNDLTLTTEIDLIPNDYRIHYAKVRILKRHALILIPLLVFAGLAYGALRFYTWEIEREVETLQQMTLVSSRQRDQITRLRKVADEFQRQLTMLGRLRSGGQAMDMFITIDRAIPPGDVWFRTWNFRRAGFVVKGQTSEVNRGYFVVIPAGSEASSAEPWQIETHMDIKGQARDHSTLSTFVQRLFDQPQIQDVRVVNTAQRSYQNTKVVDFDMRIIVRSAAGGS
ncbi:MAG: PilN domain-containing protein [Gammaproteobacteria bacterium]|nr:PilN domain-containing protein [Gammaproteobacteria bacterium]